MVRETERGAPVRWGQSEAVSDDGASQVVRGTGLEPATFTLDGWMCCDDGGSGCSR